MTGTTTLAASFILIVLANVVLGSMLQEHRTDVPPGAAPGSGPSPWGQVNVFVHARYDARGRAIKRCIFALLAVQAAVATALILRLIS